ncbi:hypothetical protein [Microbacterium sp. NPDC077184]|uniref:hypothetical protein n=1 Tax=Microbacterium sp. NPDC077184 TaxID=3154764 RepID=UPI00343A8E7B
MDARRGCRTPTHVAVAVTLSALGLVGCTSADTGGTQPPSATPSSATATATATASPSSTFAIPSEPVEGEVASAVSDRTSSPPSNSSVAGPGVLVVDRPFFVEGHCVGGRSTYEVRSADPADAGRTLIEGTLDCGAPMRSSFDYSLPYAGPVQLSFTDTDDVEQAWLRVVQP